VDHAARVRVMHRRADIDEQAQSLTQRQGVLLAMRAQVEPTLGGAQPDDKFQFERNGYFVADRKDHAPGRPVFNLAVSLKETWNK